MWVLINLFAGLISLMYPGKPSVPVIRRLIQSDTIGIEVSITYAESTAKIEIPPAPYPVRKGSKNGELIKDPSVYENDAFYPERPYLFIYLGMRRGIKYYILEVHPYQYNPIKRKVRYAESIEIKGIEKIKIPKQKDADTLLVVTPSKFLSTLDYFLFYKRVCGFIVETFVVESYWDTTRIREEIIARHPDYLLLVGDISEIPAFPRVLYIPGDGYRHRWTDLYYACRDYDYIPDMYYGRLSVESTQELSDIIDKIINYDSLNASWKSRAFFMASGDIAWHTLTEMTQNYSMEKARLNGMVVDSNFARYISHPGTPLDEAFSDGRSIAAYSGHGNKYRWGGPSFDITDIQNLPPNLRTPIVFSFACLAGSYEENDCFMEHWILEEDKGSIISFGSSTFSYWEEDDILQRRLFDVLFEGKEIGAVIDTAKLLFTRDYTGDPVLIESYYQQYNLFGDPTLKVRYGKFGKTLLSIPTISVLDDTITAYIGGSGQIGLFQWDREMILDVGSSGRIKIPLIGFEVGRVKILAQTGSDLVSSKMIHLSLEPLEDIFKVENNLTLEAISVSFFAISGKVDATIYDCSGRKIMDKSWVYSTDGEKSENWNIKDIPPGIYFLQVKQEKFWIFTGKIVKL
jgi:hypothetical protein